MLWINKTIWQQCKMLANLAPLSCFESLVIFERSLSRYIPLNFRDISTDVLGLYVLRKEKIQPLFVIEISI